MHLRGKHVREINNRRTAFIAKLLNRNGIGVVSAMITHFRDAQQQARKIVEQEGKFVLIYVKCPVDECARRDPKGLYEQAKAGNIENFTGINHPFQEPHNPDIVVNTEVQTSEESITHVLDRLAELDILPEEAEGTYGFDLTRSREREIKDRLSDLDYIDQG